MAVSPFRIYSAPECAAIAAALENALCRWSRRWFGTGKLVLEFDNINGLPGVLPGQLQAFGSDLPHYGDAESQWCTLLPDAAARDALDRSLLGTPGGAQRDGEEGSFLLALQADMAAQCLVDIGRAFPGEAQPRAGQELGAAQVGGMLRRAAVCGSGWGLARLRLGALELPLLLGPAVSAGIVPAKPLRLLGALDSARQAIIRQPASLSAALGGTALTIGEFEGLRVGDILRLDQRVDEAVSLVTPGGEVVASGQLGAREGRKAVRLGEE